MVLIFQGQRRWSECDAKWTWNPEVGFQFATRILDSSWCDGYVSALPGRALCAPHAEVATVMEGWIHVPPHRKYTPCAECGASIG